MSYTNWSTCSENKSTDHIHSMCQFVARKVLPISKLYCKKINWIVNKPVSMEDSFVFSSFLSASRFSSEENLSSCWAEITHWVFEVTNWFHYEWKHMAPTWCAREDGCHISFPFHVGQSVKSRDTNPTTGCSLPSDVVSPAYKPKSNMVP